jgi:hypothetical protein
LFIPSSFVSTPTRLVCDLPDAEPVVKRLAQQQLFEKFEIADAMPAGREWFFDHFTAAGASVGAPCFHSINRDSKTVRRISSA